MKEYKLISIGYSAKVDHVKLVTSCSPPQETQKLKVGHNSNSRDLDWTHLREMTLKGACGELTGFLTEGVEYRL